VPQDTPYLTTTAISSEIDTLVAKQYRTTLKVREKAKAYYLRVGKGKAQKAKERKAGIGLSLGLPAKPGAPTLLRMVLKPDNDFKQVDEHRNIRCKDYELCLDFAWKKQKDLGIGANCHFTFSCKGCCNMPEREKEG